MDRRNETLSALLLDYEASLKARLAHRAHEDLRAEATLASTLQEVQSNIEIDQSNLDEEQIQLKDQVLKLHTEALAILDMLNDKFRQSEELKNKADTLVTFHIKDSQEARRNLDRARSCEDVDHRNALVAEIEELITDRPRKKHRNNDIQDNCPSLPPTVNTD
ncbi:uncharacterized protein FMAN_07321 [Fusarium mangiferae]|uniref:Uncharacterized protein n=1 Tax=Fusarium mangiferae TaxID=192010 RepID=A0A1L7TA24_FUSMA|nr:uncharacterized protein FMAN_07321 [Fusarium mangiferae]CVK92425.1 uncharacterized protein FMAN_07321 [Fusarium mangiferae]